MRSNSRYIQGDPRIGNTSTAEVVPMTRSSTLGLRSPPSDIRSAAPKRRLSGMNRSWSNRLEHLAEKEVLTARALWAVCGA